MLILWSSCTLLLSNLSKVDYASLIWFPTSHNSIVRLQSIKRKSFKCMQYKNNGFYPIRVLDHEAFI